MGPVPRGLRAAGDSGCFARRGGGSGLLVVLVQRGDLVAHLRAVGDPVLHALVLDHHALLATGGDRVVVPHALDVAAIACAAAVGDDDVVEGALLGAAACKSDLDHGV